MNHTAAVPPSFSPHDCPSLLPSLLLPPRAETDDVASRRRELVDQLSILSRGISILNDIRDSGIIAAPPHASGAAAVAGGMAGPGTGAGAGAGAGSVPGGGVGMGGMGMYFGPGAGAAPSHLGSGASVASMSPPTSRAADLGAYAAAYQNGGGGGAGFNMVGGTGFYAGPMMRGGGGPGGSGMGPGVGGSGGGGGSSGGRGDYGGSGRFSSSSPGAESVGSIGSVRGGGRESLDGGGHRPPSQVPQPALPQLNQRGASAVNVM